MTAAARPALVGVDVGTGSTRACVFSTEGHLLAAASRPIRLWRPDGHAAEQSSEDIWAAVCASVREAVAAAGEVAPRGIGFDATCSLVVLDGEGRGVSVASDGDPARDVVVWMDHRADAEAAEVNALADGPAAAVLRHVGGRISPEMQVPKLMWLKRRTPGAWARARHFMDLPDWLSYRATGGAARSLCSLVCKWAYLPHAGGFDAGFFRAVGLGDLADEGWARIGTVALPPGARAGGLSREAAGALGLPEGLPVPASYIDAHAGAVGTLGMALDRAGLEGDAWRRRVALVGGTSSCHMALSPEARFVPGVWGPYRDAAVEGLWLAEGGQSATGALLDRLIADHPARSAMGDANPHAWLAARLDALAAQAPHSGAVSEGLHVYPDVLGNRSPHADPTLRGMVSGLPLGATPDDLARIYLAAVQGIAHGTREILAALDAAGWAVDTLVASGGDARNPVFLREHADATGCRVALPEEPGAAVPLGAAMAAGVAAGVHPDLPTAMARMSRPARVVEPSRDPAVRAWHAAKAAVQRRMREDQYAYRALMARAGPG